jgi:aspartyl aminopeptidase
MSINPHFEEKIISGIIVSKTGNSVVIKTPTNGLYNRNISKISKIKRIAKEKNMEVLTC